MRRVVVTGASGFVGRQVVRALVEHGEADVHAVARRSIAAGEARAHSVDLFDGAAWRRLLREVRPDTLIHVAWFVEPGRFWTDPVNDRWVDVSLENARDFVRAGGARWIGVGSMAEYDWTAGQPMGEAATPLRPRMRYGEAKLAALRGVQALAEQTDLGVAWARLFSLYGIYENRARFVPSIARALLAGMPTICTDEAQVRDYMDVRDVGRAIAVIAAGDIAGPVNVASGDGVTRLQVAEALARAAGRPDLIRRNPNPSASRDPDALVADVARLREDVGFVPAFGLEHGLQDAVEFWRGVPHVAA